jgi:hypothetical protein
MMTITVRNSPALTEAKRLQAVDNASDGSRMPDQQERRWVAVFALGVMAITLLPYLIGYTVQGTDWRFTGFMIAVEDGNSYIAKMLTSSGGAWLFRTPYTAYPQRGVLLFIPYFLLGKLAAPPELHDQLVALYHIFRLGSGYLAILATYDFIAYFIRKISLRRLGLALAILGGGLGWLLLLVGRDSWLGSLPLEFYSPESFGFLGLFGIPHLTIARAFMLWGLLAYLRTAELDLDARSAFKPGLKIGLLWLITGLIQPLIGMVVGAVAIIYLITIFLWQLWLGLNQSAHVRWTEWRKRLYLAFWAGLVALPWVAYNFVSLYQDPFLRVWTAQSSIPSPHPIHYLLAYGLMLLPAVIGGNYLTNKSPWSGWLPVGWVVALPILAYAPYSLQRRLPDGIWVALVVLAMAGLEQIDLRAEKLSLAQWFKLPMFLAFPSTIILVLGAFLAVLNPARPIFRPAAEVAAFTRLADASQPGQVVLAAYETGNALPAWAPVRVLIGQGPESVNLAELKPRVTQFYQVDASETTRQELLDEFQVSFVFWGPAERSLGDWDPIQASYLELQYQSDDYAIFSVRNH